jgi:hypothetical protein
MCDLSCREKRQAQVQIERLTKELSERDAEFELRIRQLKEEHGQELTRLKEQLSEINRGRVSIYD